MSLVYNAVVVLSEQQSDLVYIYVRVCVCVCFPVLLEKESTAQDTKCVIVETTILSFLSCLL